LLSLWAVLAGILVTDVLNPVLLAAVIYSLGTKRPYATACALIAGHTLAYLSAGVLLVFGIEALEHRLSNPEPMDFWIELGVGLVVFGVGVASALPQQRGQSPDFNDRGELSLGSAFGLGVLLNLIGIPFAVPYFAAIAQILKADLPTAANLGLLLGYNLLYALPFALVVLLRVLYRRRAAALLERLNRSVDRIGAFVMPVLLLALGGVLVADAMAFLTRGTPLFTW